MGSAEHPNGSRDVVIAFANDDSNGHVTGTLTFMGRTFYVDGNWAAAGSIPGRNYSAFAVWGTDRQAATEYVAAAGTVTGPGSAPQSIQLNLIRASTEDDQQYGWSNKLLPI